MQEIKPTYINFEQARLLSKITNSEDFVGACYYKGEFFVNKNLLYISGINEFIGCVDKKELFTAPEQWQVIEWLRINHSVWVYSYPIHPFNSDEDNDYPKTVWISKIISTNYKFEESFINSDNELAINHHHSPQEAYSAAFDYILKELI